MHASVGPAFLGRATRSRRAADPVSRQAKLAKLGAALCREDRGAGPSLARLTEPSVLTSGPAHQETTHPNPPKVRGCERTNADKPSPVSRATNQAAVEQSSAQGVPNAEATLTPATGTTVPAAIVELLKAVGLCPDLIKMMIHVESNCRNGSRSRRLKSTAISRCLQYSTSTAITWSVTQ